MKRSKYSRRRVTESSPFDDINNVCCVDQKYKKEHICLIKLIESSAQS